MDEICGDLLILYSGSNLDLENTVGDRLLLPLSLPVKTVHLDGNDLVSKGVQVSVLTPRLDLPDDEGLGDGRGLLLLGFVGISLSLHLGSSGSLSLGIGVEEVVELVFGGGGLGSRLLGLLLLSALATLGSLLALQSRTGLVRHDNFIE